MAARKPKKTDLQFSTSRVTAMAQFVGKKTLDDLSLFLPELPIGVRVELAQDIQTAYIAYLSSSLMERGITIVK